MPKNVQKRHFSDDDDSEPGPKPSKKAKNAKTSSASTSKSKGNDATDGVDSEGNPYWTLSKARRVGVSKFKDALLINIREYYEKDGEFKPGKKGISLSIDQYKALIKAIPAINEQLRKEGTIVDSGDDDAADDAANDDEQALAKKPKTKSAKKANIEATSDEDSN